ncbi:MAG: GtrA family protein [Paludibacteraceae bacterium]|nr:GtrA family protein [Paludibacteraceae bacterium]MBQ8386500.1 GtrA family protein [Paludibacteraceae bacterium]
MKTLTGRLPMKYRSAVRFVLVGALGTGIQYGIYYLLLDIFQRHWQDLGILTSVAFTAGFIIEMICNYFITSFYTFKMRPSWKNAGGFLFGRAINYVLQLLLLNLLIWLHLSEEYSGILAIMLAGVINYFVLLPFYKDKKREK